MPKYVVGEIYYFTVLALHLDSKVDSTQGESTEFKPQGFHVHVDISSAPVPALADELREWKYIAPSAMLDSNDSVITALAQRALGGSRLHRTPDTPRTRDEVGTVHAPLW